MNIAKLNTTHEDIVVIKKSKGGMKYYDCLSDWVRDEEHGPFLVDTVKFISSDGNNVIIGPEAAWVESEGGNVAVGVDMSKKVYLNGKWMNLKDFLFEMDGFNTDTHPEITEEEFYHIPEDAYFSLLPEDGEVAKKNFFETLLPLCKRHSSHIKVEPLPLVPVWYKSLTVSIVSQGAMPQDFGVESVSSFVVESLKITITAGSLTFTKEGDHYYVYFSDGTQAL